MTKIAKAAGFLPAARLTAHVFWEQAGATFLSFFIFLWLSRLILSLD